jgi:hypothetical protein
VPYPPRPTDPPGAEPPTAAPPDPTGAPPEPGSAGVSVLLQLTTPSPTTKARVRKQAPGTMTPVAKIPVADPRDHGYWRRRQDRLAARPRPPHAPLDIHYAGLRKCVTRVAPHIAVKTRNEVDWRDNDSLAGNRLTRKGPLHDPAGSLPHGAPRYGRAGRRRSRKLVLDGIINHTHQRDLIGDSEVRDATVRRDHSGPAIIASEHPAWPGTAPRIALAESVRFIFGFTASWDDVSLVLATAPTQCQNPTRAGVALPVRRACRWRGRVTIWSVAIHG